MRALPQILAERPGHPAAGRRARRRGGGRRRRCPSEMRERVEFLGMVSDEDKARLLRSVDVYVAPNTGGESFGIILVEAMSAGAPVLASDLDAFAQVLDEGAAGELFANEDADALADRRGTAAGRPGAPRGAARAGQRACAPLRLVDGRARTSCRSTRRSRTARRRWPPTSAPGCGPGSAWPGTGPALRAIRPGAGRACGGWSRR